MSSNVRVRRTYKDSLFRMIFREKEELLSLYNVVNGSDYKNTEDLEINTIEDVIYMGIKNDVSFLIDDYLNLYEAQSSWNPNMPLRGLFYLAALYRGYVGENGLDLYSEALLKLPAPNFIVFYNGSRARKDMEQLRLSDSYIKQNRDGYALECTVTVLNINYGHNEKIMKGCRKLWEYAYLVEEIRKGIKAGLRLEEAVDRAVEHCIENEILADFLRRHQMEVKDVILTEYNEVLHVENEKRLSFEQGVAQGVEQGLEQGVAQGLEQGLEQGMRALILDNLEEDIPQQRILEKLKARFGLSEEEAVERLRRYTI